MTFLFDLNLCCVTIHSITSSNQYRQSFRHYRIFILIFEAPPYLGVGVGMEVCCKLLKVYTSSLNYLLSNDGE